MGVPGSAIFRSLVQGGPEGSKQATRFLAPEPSRDPAPLVIGNHPPSRRDTLTPSSRFIDDFGRLSLGPPNRVQNLDAVGMGAFGMTALERSVVLVER